MKYKRILVVTDNEVLLKKFKYLLKLKKVNLEKFDFAFSYNNTYMMNKYVDDIEIKPISMKEDSQYIIEKYDLIISLHCKQIFPNAIIRCVKCINVHPGYNPYNRGWFPQVFSIINKMPCGATIHIMDEQLDNGSIIAQRQIEVNEWDTSETLYEKIIELELKLLDENLENILNDNYKTTKSKIIGNINFKKDFDKLCKLDLNKESTIGETIDLLRALQFSKYRNAYFITKDGKKVWVEINISVDDEK